MRGPSTPAAPLLLLLGSLLGCGDEGCGGPPVDSAPVDTALGLDGECLEASERLGGLVCLHRVDHRGAFEAVSAVALVADQIASTKYLLPAADTADPLPLLFVNVQRYSLHYDLMVEAFPERFPGFTRADYLRLLVVDKDYFAGNVTEYYDARGGGTFFGFTVWDDPADERTTVRYEEALHAWTELSGAFGLGPLTFVPSSSNQAEAAAGWDAPFPIRGVDSGVNYEVYTRGVGYGTLTRLTLDDLAEATEQGAFGHESLLVLDEAPFDIERVISGVVTGTRQGELSHLNVRSAARGTPNCYLAEPLEALAAWEGRLVRMECGEEALTVSEADLEEAEAWWASQRPEPVVVPTPDTSVTALVGLLELPTQTAEERAAAVAAYGAKGANLAALYQRIPPEVQLQGFVVPFAWYQAFMDEGSWTVDLGAGEAEHSFTETVEAWLEDEDFQRDPALRRARLEALREAMQGAPVDPALVELLRVEILEVFGDEAVMVRLRSSSNAEDALTFSGAGLYDSTSACAADSVDTDEDGPSLCDPERSSERSLERGLRAVWASVWNMQAYEEREWYGVDHREVKMGVLVNTQSANERANIVAFTGSPTSADDRTLINAQVGELDVVSAAPGVYPERTLVTLDAQGQVTDILRSAGSSELSEGFFVLSDARVQELAELYWDIEASFPIDALPERGEILLDSEWKVLEDGRLVIKQVRPFLRELD